MSMKKESTKLLALMILGLFMFSFMSGFVSATDLDGDKIDDYPECLDDSDCHSGEGCFYDEVSTLSICVPFDEGQGWAAKGTDLISKASTWLVIITAIILIVLMKSGNVTIKTIASFILILGVIFLLGNYTLGTKLEDVGKVNFEKILTDGDDKFAESDFYSDDSKPLYKYVMGIESAIPEDKGIEQLTVRGFIILFAVWIIFILAFADFFATFGLFWSKWVGIVIGILVAIILSNLGTPYQFMAGMMGVFSIFAGGAIIASFFGILIAMVGVHFGLGNIQTWIERRNAATQAARLGTKVEKSTKNIVEAGEGVERGAE